MPSLTKRRPALAKLVLLGALAALTATGIGVDSRLSSLAQAQDQLTRQTRSVRAAQLTRLQAERRIKVARPELERLSKQLLDSASLQLAWLEFLRSHRRDYDRLSYRIDRVESSTLPSAEPASTQTLHLRFQTGLRHEEQLAVLLRDLGVGRNNQVRLLACRLQRRAQAALVQTHSESLLDSDCSLVGTGFDPATAAMDGLL